MKHEDLASLSQTQLRELVTRASALLDRPQDDSATGLVHDALDGIFRKRGEKLPPMSVIKKLPHYGSFRDGSTALLEYIDTYLKPSTRVERLKAVNVLLAMLIRWLERREIPISHRAVSQSLSRVASIVDKQFPGYRQSGLLPMIVKAHQRARAV